MTGLELIERLGFPGGSDGKVSAYNARDLGLIPGSGKPPGKGNDSPLQYSCLQNTMDATAHSVAESDMTEQLHFHQTHSQNIHFNKISQKVLKEKHVLKQDTLLLYNP